MIYDDIKLAGMLFTLADQHKELEAITHNLSIVTFRFKPEGLSPGGSTDYVNKLNEEIMKRVQVGGETFLSNAVINDNFCLMVSTLNLRANMDDISAWLETVYSLQP